MYTHCKVLYIYIQKLINSNKIDFYDYLVQLKQKLQIENIICIDKGNPSKFEQFEFILDNIERKKKYVPSFKKKMFFNGDGIARP